MIYGQNQISQGQTPGQHGSTFGFGPGYTSGGGMVGLPDPAQLQAQQAAQQQAAQAAQAQQQMAMQQAQMQAMQQAQQQLAQAQMGAQQMAPQFLSPQIDALWAKLIDRLAMSPVADDSQLFADVSAVVIQTFPPSGLAQDALKRWAEQYTGQQQQQQMQQQQQQQMQQQLDMPMQLPEDQTAQQQQASGPFIAGRIRNAF